MMQKANGWKSYHMCSGRIEPRLVGLQERLPFRWFMELRLSSFWKLVSQRREPVHSIRGTMMSNWQRVWTWLKRRGKMRWFNWPTTSKTEARLWCQCKIDTFNSWWSGVTKSCGYYKESSLGKVMTKLGRVLPHHLRRWYWSIFSRRSGRTCNTTSLECKQPEEVLLLINIFMINLFVLYIKCLYFLPF